MKTIKILLMTVTLLTLASCDKKVFLRSYVARYYAVDSFELLPFKSLGDKKVVGFKHPVNTRHLGGYGSTGNEKTIYDELCIKHNDMGYNRKVLANRPDEITTSYLGIDFVSIKVVSDADFDAEHPAGTELGNITRFLGISPKKYIDSGYKDTFDWDTYYGPLLGRYHYYELTPCLHPIDKLVSDLTIDDLVLLGPGWSRYMGELVFETQPTLSKIHHLTVTLIPDKGKPLSATIEMTF